MKLCNYALILSFVFLFSCTKESLKSKDDLRSAELVAKYNLKVIDNFRGREVMNFRSFDELEVYLKKKEALSKESIDSNRGSLVAKLESSKRRIVTASESAEGSTNQIDAVFTTTSGSATLTFPYLRERGFPMYVYLNWAVGGGVTSLLGYGGANYGSWTYTQRSGYDQFRFITVTGLYTEFYGVNGVYVYEQLFNFELYATYVFKANSPGRIIANVSYTKQERK